VDAGASSWPRVCSLSVPSESERARRFLCVWHRREISAAPVRDGNTLVALSGLAKGSQTNEDVPATGRGGLTERRASTIRPAARPSAFACPAVCLGVAPQAERR
jgi:hypothetical protein